MRELERPPSGGRTRARPGGGSAAAVGVGGTEHVNFVGGIALEPIDYLGAAILVQECALQERA